MFDTFINFIFVYKVKKSEPKKNVNGAPPEGYIHIKVKYLSQIFLGSLDFYFKYICPIYTCLLFERVGARSRPKLRDSLRAGAELNSAPPFNS